MEQSAHGAVYLYVRSGGALFGFPIGQLAFILSTCELMQGRTGENLPDGTCETMLDGKRVDVLHLNEMVDQPSNDEEKHALVVTKGTGVYGILVDEVLDTVQLAAEQIMSLPGEVLGPQNGFLSAVAVQDDETMCLLIDTERLLDQAATARREKETAK